jgi:hypothetical protein
MMGLWHMMDPVTKEVIETDDLHAYAKAMENPDSKFVAQTVVGDKRVSTVFLGLDHGFGGTPKFFETMVFGLTDFNDEYCERYTTYGEAWNGHQEVVYRLENGLELRDSEE